MRTYSYIIISSILLLLGFSFQSFAQEKKKNEQKKDSVALFQGLWIETDIAPLIESALFNKYAYSMQGNLQANLNNKYFPIVELGLAGADKTTLENIQFKTNGLFGKVGMDFSMMKPKPNATQKNNYVLVGARFGMSHFNYSIYNQTITDNYWGNSETFNLESIPATKIWAEIVAGLRVDVYKRIYMGWTVRNKHLITQTKSGENAPWYIPGYGIGNSAIWGFNYCIGFKLK